MKRRRMPALFQMRCSYDPFRLSQSILSFQRDKCIHSFYARRLRSASPSPRAHSRSFLFGCIATRSLFHRSFLSSSPALFRSLVHAILIYCLVTAQHYCHSFFFFFHAPHRVPEASISDNSLISNLKTSTITYLSSSRCSKLLR